MNNDEENENGGQSLAIIVTHLHIGSSLQSTSISKIAQSCSGVRACALEIRNYRLDLELMNPTHYLLSGINDIPPAPVIKPGFAEACLFRKLTSSTYGTAGVLTYDIDLVFMNNDKSELVNRISKTVRLVLLWAVPLVGANQHAIGILEDERPADRELFRTMEAESQTWFKRERSGVCVNYASTIYDRPVKLSATLSDVGRATWVVNIQ